MKNTVVLVSLVALVMGSMVACSAATSVYGVSGLIETPDDAIAELATPQLIGVYAGDLVGNNESGSSFGAVMGILPKLEVGAVLLDSNARGVEAKSLVNAKFRLVEESFANPSVTIGMVDMSKNLDSFNSQIDKTSTFIVIGKNLTSVAENVAGSVVKPVKGTIGVGTGLYKGGFAGLTISASPRFDVMVEYLAKGIRQDDTLNAGIRFAPIPGLNMTVGALDFKDVYGSVTYSVVKY